MTVWVEWGVKSKAHFVNKTTEVVVIFYNSLASYHWPLHFFLLKADVMCYPWSLIIFLFLIMWTKLQNNEITKLKNGQLKG